MIISYAVVILVGAAVATARYLVDLGHPNSAIALAFVAGIMFAVPVRISLKVEVRDWLAKQPPETKS